MSLENYILDHNARYKVNHGKHRQATDPYLRDILRFSFEQIIQALLNFIESDGLLCKGHLEPNLVAKSSFFLIYELHIVKSLKCLKTPSEV